VYYDTEGKACIENGNYNYITVNVFATCKLCMNLSHMDYNKMLMKQISLSMKTQETRKFRTMDTGTTSEKFELLMNYSLARLLSLVNKGGR